MQDIPGRNKVVDRNGNIIDVSVKGGSSMTENKPWPCMDCRVIMTPVDEDHCKCPVCGTEVWYKYDAPDLSEEEPPPAGKSQYVSRSLPEHYRVPPGGSKSGKRSKKKGTKIYVDDVGFGA